MGTLQQLAQFWLAREHERNGGAALDREAAAANTNELLKQAQLRRALQQIELAPALQEATIRNLDEPNRLPPNPPQPKLATKILDNGNIGVVNMTDGTVHDTGQRAQPTRVGSAPVGGAMANPFLVKVNGEDKLAVRDKAAPGGLRFVDNIGGTPVSPGPTADMRNNEIQAAAVDPAFDLVGKSLDNLDASTQGFGSSLSALVPGTKAYYAKDHFITQAKALLGAIVARQAGEGSRLSDEDRKAYSQAATLVNNAILLPGGVAEARSRMNEAKQLLDTVIARRRMGGMSPATAHTPGAVPAAATGVSPNVQRILDMIRSKNAGQ